MRKKYEKLKFWSLFLKPSARNENIRIAEDEFPQEMVKSRFHKLWQFEMRDVFEFLDKKIT